MEYKNGMRTKLIIAGVGVALLTGGVISIAHTVQGAGHYSAIVDPEAISPSPSPSDAPAEVVSPSPTPSDEATSTPKASTTPGSSTPSIAPSVIPTPPPVTVMTAKTHWVQYHPGDEVASMPGYGFNFYCDRTYSDGTSDSKWIGSAEQYGNYSGVPSVPNMYDAMCN